MIQIHLAGGRVAIVDDEDAHLAAFKWHVQKAGATSYAKRNLTRAGLRTTEFLHRAVMRAGAGQEVDHINGDGLDNRRANLRFATRAENSRNTRKPANATGSGFKGVYQQRGRWRARIQTGRRTRSLGMFATPEEAARAYDAAAIELYGPFAKVNGV